MRPRKGDIKIRRRDKSIFLADAPDWWDKDCKIQTVSQPARLMDDVYLVHPVQGQFKLNTHNRQFERSSVDLPAPPTPVYQKPETKKENPIKMFANRCKTLIDRFGEK